jgi:hypothetical protein
VSPLTGEYRRDLLLRLGLFGVRLCLRELQDRPGATASSMSRMLVEVSGVERLVEVLDAHLRARAAVLKARSVLVSLRALAGELAAIDPGGSRQLLAAVEEVEAGAYELAELRLLHLMLTGAVEFPIEIREEVARLTGGGDPAERLGLPAEAEAATQLAVTLERLEEWRTRAAHPLTDRVSADACEIVIRSYERIFSEL